MNELLNIAYEYRTKRNTIKIETKLSLAVKIQNKTSCNMLIIYILTNL